MFAGIIFIVSFFNYESPRYLIKCGKTEEATRNLSRVRGLPMDDSYIVKEIAGIQNQLDEEREATMGQGWKGYLKEMFLMPNNAYRKSKPLLCKIHWSNNAYRPVSRFWLSTTLSMVWRKQYHRLCT